MIFPLEFLKYQMLPIPILQRVNIFLSTLPKALASDMSGVEGMIVRRLGAVARQGQYSVLSYLENLSQLETQGAKGTKESVH